VPDESAMSTPGLPSIVVFRKYFAVRHLDDGATATDAAGVLSVACFDEWLHTRSKTSFGKRPEQVFQRCVGVAPRRVSVTSARTFFKNAHGALDCH